MGVYRKVPSIPIETQPHVLVECPCIRPLWTMVENKLYNLCNHRLNIKISHEMLYQGLFPKDSEHRKLALLCIYTAAHTIWSIRNKIKKESQSFTHVSLINNFIRRFDARLRADFHRMPFSAFSEFWQKTHAFVSNQTTENLLIVNHW